MEDQKLTEPSNALVPRPALNAYIPPPGKSEFEAMISMANTLAKAQGFLPAHFFGQPYKILAAILYGRDLGISATNALQHIIVIEGKATADAQLIGMLVRRAGHRVEDVTSDQASTVKITRSDDGSIHEFTFSLNDAQRAGILRTGSAWTKFPAAMLYARALTGCARKAAQDALMGTVYTPDELGVEVDDEGSVALPPSTPTGEIPLEQAAPASVAALEGAQGSDSRQQGAQDSPPNTAIQGSVAAVTSEPPQASKPKGGPRAKRGNVVQAPLAGGDREGDSQPSGRAGRTPSLSPPVALDDDGGEMVYMAELRRQVRTGAAVLRRLRITMKNTEAALNGQPLAPVPEATPNADSDESLRVFIENKFTGQTLETLKEKDLESVGTQIDALIKKVEASIRS